eukprot:scaffold216359_cov13-Tisochrysis_lutea.AAC.1
MPEQSPSWMQFTNGCNPPTHKLQMNKHGMLSSYFFHPSSFCKLPLIHQTSQAHPAHGRRTTSNYSSRP